MRISRLGGYISNADTTLRQADKIECLFEADGAIPVGAPVVLDTGNTSGKLVIAGTIALDHRFRGIYEGVGGSGAVASVSGTSGKAAVDGDLIFVTTYGKAVALVDGTGTAVADGDGLACGDGEMIAGGTIDVADNPIAVALEANASSVAARVVFVAAM